MRMRTAARPSKHPASTAGSVSGSAARRLIAASNSGGDLLPSPASIVPRHEYIRGFDVAVYDQMAVGVRDGREDIEKERYPRLG